MRATIAITKPVKTARIGENKMIENKLNEKIIKITDDNNTRRSFLEASNGVTDIVFKIKIPEIDTVLHLGISKDKDELVIHSKDRLEMNMTKCSMNIFSDSPSPRIPHNANLIILVEVLNNWLDKNGLESAFTLIKNNKADKIITYSVPTDLDAEAELRGNYKEDLDVSMTMRNIEEIVHYLNKLKALLESTKGF